MNAAELSLLITRSLESQGFETHNGRIVPPELTDKEQLRILHATAVAHRVDLAAPRLRRHEDRLLSRFARGVMVEPTAIFPRLVEVQAGSEDELLFRYVALHWKVPVSSGYGRRLRFLVVDAQNEKLIGVIGLGDPVFNLSARDRWVGWGAHARRDRLQNVMDAFILGAVPPYSALLCGKLVAMLVASTEVRKAFKNKYDGKRSVIRRKAADSRLALVTTMSALGRSSVYNRIRYDERLLYHRLGFSQGSGEFHFSNGLYGAIFDYASRHCTPTAKKNRWGVGFRNRREVIRKCLQKIGLSPDLLYHGVQREVFAVPLAKNTCEFLRQEHSKLSWHTASVEELSSFFNRRWLLPRALWDNSFRHFEPEMYKIWGGNP
jgi:hypothetical protein